MYHRFNYTVLVCKYSWCWFDSGYRSMLWGIISLTLYRDTFVIVIFLQVHTAVVRPLLTECVWCVCVCVSYTVECVIFHNSSRSQMDGLRAWWSAALLSSFCCLPPGGHTNTNSHEDTTTALRRADTSTCACARQSLHNIALEILGASGLSQCFLPVRLHSLFYV